MISRIAKRNRTIPSSWQRPSLFEQLEARQLLSSFNPANAAALQSIFQGTSTPHLQLGDTITLNAGTTYVGQFTLPNLTTGSGWVTIQSSNLASLPAAGTRVS